MSLLGQSLHRARRQAGVGVRFRPKTDLISSSNSVAHTFRLCNRAEEFGHAGSRECDTRAQASAVVAQLASELNLDVELKNIIFVAFRF
jgi:hypothetical protein